MIDQDVGESADGPRDAGPRATCRRRARHRSRVASTHGGTYLLPTVVRCDRGHSLANREFLFPYASVVEVDRPRAAGRPRPVAGGHVRRPTARFRDALRRLAARGPAEPRRISTTTRSAGTSRTKGNLFEHLYARRAIQRLA
jgi:hypothetical protein